MKELLIKNLHLLIFAWAGYGLYGIYEEKIMILEQTTQQTPVIESKIKKATKKLKDITKFKANLAASKERVNEVVKQIEKMQKQLPTDVNDAEVQRIMGNIATDLRIANATSKSNPERVEGFYFAKEYVFNGKGTFLQFLIFFEKLAKQERILNVKKVSLSQSENSLRSRFQVLKFETVIESFKYNVSYRERANVK